MFGSSLSNEYLLAAEHFSLDRNAILGICLAAIETIFGGDQEKERLRVSLSSFRQEEIVNSGKAEPINDL